MKFPKTLLLFLVFLLKLEAHAQKTSLSIPLGGNAFSSKHLDGSKTITNKGIENWTDSTEFFTVYFRVSKPGNIVLTIPDKPRIEGESTLVFSIKGKENKAYFTDNEKSISAFDGKIGSWKIKDTGYVALIIKGLYKTKAHFPSFSSIQISGSAVNGQTAYVKNNEGDFFHWGRRGPSVHLNYQLPQNKNVEWFYNEVTVPTGNDLVGSYFMANGFGEGYFGMQVNSDKERRILFSVWSPFNTDDPKNIPESQKIVMLKKGENVQTGEFGNEGAGGQSFLRYNWKAENTYKFLLHGVPDKIAIPRPNPVDGTVDLEYLPDSTTTYSAYFFAPELNKWLFIASFKRPKTQTYLKHLHSFLENFIPEQGDKSRKVKFNNQWVCDENGNWTELNEARFTTDNTGMKRYRTDFSGGLVNDAFFLKNCGFFNQYTKPKAIFTRNLAGRKPEINFSKLPYFFKKTEFLIK